MGSANNWLGFSLSPQELPSSQSHSPTTAVSHLISGHDDVSANCFTLSGDSTSDTQMTMRPDASFGILEALNRPPNQQQDWNLKYLDFKGGSSELSMLVGSSNNHNNMDDDEPKLEDFLGGNSLSHQDHKLASGLTGAYSNSNDYMFSNTSFHVQDAGMVAMNPNDGSLMTNANVGGTNNSIGLSMIKTWLRNQPAPQVQHVAADNMSTDLSGTNSDTNCSGAMVGNVIGSMKTPQSLSLSMSTGSQSSTALPLIAAVQSGGGECSSSDNKQKGTVGGVIDAQTGAIEAVNTRKSIDTFGQRTSIYRGVTRHRWTGRYEAHLWDNSCRREGQTRKGRQVYLGGYDKEDKAARSYDLAALKYWGPTTTTNFPISNYEKELEEMKHMTRQEYVASLRRKSSGFSRGASMYRGVTRHHQHGRWQARIGRVAGNKDLYLGTFSTQEEAAEAYDVAAIKFRGLNAVTNFDMSRYDVKSILESSTLPIGGAAKRLKESSDHHGEASSVHGRRTDHDDRLAALQYDAISSYGSAQYHQNCPTIAFHHNNHPLNMQYPYNTNGQLTRGGWCKQEQDHDIVAAAHSLQDLHQLQLGNSTNTHNFFQTASGIHNLMGMDSSSLEHSTGSNSSVMYNAGGGYMLPMSTVVTDHHQGSSSTFGDSEGKQMIMYDNIVGADHLYGSASVRNNNSAYNNYHMQQNNSSAAAGFQLLKADGYNEQSSTWLQSGSAQGLATSRNGNNMGALFSVWNDA